jgi:hypothetical protein
MLVTFSRSYTLVPCLRNQREREPITLYRTACTDLPPPTFYLLATHKGGAEMDLAQTDAHLLLALLCCIFLHALLHPGSGLCGVFFHLRLVLEQFLDRVRVRYMATLLDAWARGHALFPGLERWELVNVDAGPAGAGNPAVMRDVCCGEGVSLVMTMGHVWVLLGTGVKGVCV